MSGRGTIGPSVAGSWYPEDPLALRARLDSFLERDRSARESAATRDAVPVRAVIAPHAGYRYSGAVAGRGFAALVGTHAERVILIGPSHYFAFRGGAVPRAGGYRTPLGVADLDTEAIRALAEHPAVRADDEPFRPEHSLEAEIPFLQQGLAPGWRLVPVLIGGGGGRAEAASLAEALRPWVTPHTLVIASSDFTHFGSRFGFEPFHDEVPERIERLDRGAIEPILGGDFERFEDYVDRTGATICGRHAIDVMLRLLPGARGQLAAYDTSGRLTGDWGHSVSYASVVLGDAARD